MGNYIADQKLNLNFARKSKIKKTSAIIFIFSNQMNNTIKKLITNSQ